MEGKCVGGRGLRIAGGRGLRARGRDLIERLIQLRRESRFISKKRKRKPKLVRGLGLDHVQRLAGGVVVPLQIPVHNLSALVGKDDLVLCVFNRGLRHNRRCNSRGGRGSLHGA